MMLDAARRQRQHPVPAVEGLNVRLLMEAEHRRMTGRIQVEDAPALERLPDTVHHADQRQRHPNRDGKRAWGLAGSLTPVMLRNGWLSSLLVPPLSYHRQAREVATRFTSVQQHPGHPPVGRERIALVTADRAVSGQKAQPARVVFDRFHVEHPRLGRAGRGLAGGTLAGGRGGGQDAQKEGPLLAVNTRRGSSPARSGACRLRAGRIALSTALRVEGVLGDHSGAGQAPTMLQSDLASGWSGWQGRTRRRSSIPRTVRKHAVAIFAYLDTRMANGPILGINNMLPVLARRAYGFPSFGPLISVLFLCCGGIELAPPHSDEFAVRQIV